MKTSQREVHLRPETPTRALLRRVQRRSSTGIAPPPLPIKRYQPSKLDQVAEGHRNDANMKQKIGDEEQSEGEEEDMQVLMSQIDQMHDDIDGKDARILELEAQLSQTSLNRSATVTSSQSGGGLTRAAALKLEREFASQERILQGLQKDNEAKTIEVEKLRREKKTMADFLARQYGNDDWEKVVFALSSSQYGKSNEDVCIEQATPSKFLLGMTSPMKGPVARLAKTSEGMVESSFFSAVDESIVGPIIPVRSSSPDLPAVSVDLAAILNLIESQKMLIKGFERNNALKMVECQETLKLAREKEELWSNRLALHQQVT